jgi:hypothetical protein
LGLLGFAFARAESGFIALRLCVKEGWVDFGVGGDWVCFARKLVGFGSLLVVCGWWWVDFGAQ